MAVSTMLGTAKRTIHFGILIYLETQEINLPGNLQDRQCDILYIFMRNFFCFKKKFLPPLDPVVFFEKFLPQAPMIFCETDPFSLMLQPCNPDFLTPANRDFKKNVSF